MSSKKILSVGFEIPGYSDDCLDFNSKRSLIDADIVVYAPLISGHYGLDADFQGKRTYSQSGSFKVAADIAHWKSEITSFLSVGGTVVVILTPLDKFNLHTGDKQTSGTGRNRQVTNLVAVRSNYESLPLALDGLTLSEGRQIVPINGAGDKYRIPSELLSYFDYRVFFTPMDEVSPIYTTKDPSRVIGASTTKFGGNLVLLPHLSYEGHDFIEYKDDDEESAQWSQDALKFGKQFVSYCVALDKISDNTVATPSPEWSSAEEYSLSQEIEVQKKITNISYKISQLTEEKGQLEKELTDVTEIKALLYGTGTELEVATRKALNLLGYHAEGYDDGILELDQVITSSDKTRYIGECEGKDTKQINIDKLRQLIESMNADFARDDVTEKAYGILFGNPNRLTKPDDRKEWFTDKCIIGAKREMIALIKTPDLYTISQYLLSNKDKKYARQCRKSILDQLGSVVTFPPVPEKPANEEMASSKAADEPK